MKGAFSFRAQLLRDESVLWFGCSLQRASSWLVVLERTLWLPHAVICHFYFHFNQFPLILTAGFGRHQWGSAADGGHARFLFWFFALLSKRDVLSVTGWPRQKSFSCYSATVERWRWWWCRGWGTRKSYSFICHWLPASPSSQYWQQHACCGE